MNIHMAKKWPKTVVYQSFKSNICFRSLFIQSTVPPVLKIFRPSTVSETDLSIDSSQGPLWVQQKRLTKGYHAYLFFWLLILIHDNIVLDYTTYIQQLPFD